tara:strand:+ start:2981 stop:3466 length:486 start_codon:yes stop_codon:yes gene_type:complete
MATRIYSGKDGLMYIGTSTAAAAKVRSWQFQASLGLLDISTLGDKVKQYAPGVQDFTGSATILYYQKSGTTSPVNDASTLIKNLIKGGTDGVQPTSTDDKTVTLSLAFAADGTVSPERRIKFKCFITSASIGASVGEVVSADISFTVTGGLDGTQTSGTVI